MVLSGKWELSRPPDKLPGTPVETPCVRIGGNWCLGREVWVKEVRGRKGCLLSGQGFFFFLEEVGFEGGYESWEVCREELRGKHGKRKRDV